ncbi:MAG TPA: DNA-binding transcriptional regulator [Verrucomicrobiae bacterium]|nr:DNA-binding transcriptional regulator [Verrucomicrobiae bacterium]
MRKKQKRVLIALGWYDYRLHRGIEKYAQEHGWHLSEDLAREKVIPWGWDGDGILAWLAGDDDLADFVVHTGKPTVDFSFRRSHLPFSRVLEDHAMAAQLVADHFLTRGLRNFSFYSDADNWVHEERGQAYARALKQADRECTWIRWYQSPSLRNNRSDRKAWQRKRDWLAMQLKHAPKPLGLFTAVDGLALDVLETCERLGIAVPEEIAIIGAGNSLLAVDAMQTPISSVDGNLELVGYRGAELLDDLMAGRPVPRQPVRIPPAGLIARKSSDLMAVKHHGIAKSLHFIWEHYHESIGIQDLMKISAMSRSGLHQAFLDQVGRSPGHELHRVRIEQAKRLLGESNRKMEVVAEMCGYQSANSFWVAFKKSTGLSPNQYRKTLLR